jgi:membrane-bound serine protease (ClpP class)
LGERGLVFRGFAMAICAPASDNTSMNACLTLATTLAQSNAQSQGGGDDTQWMVFAIIAFGVALALLVLEAFVPSGGVLGVLAGLVAVAGIVMFFRFDTTWGMWSMALSLLALPFVLAAMLWAWPNTPIGRALTLEENQKRANEEGPPIEGAIAVGLQGEALTDLRPVGACRLNGVRLDCMAQAGVIEKGAKVKVVNVEGTSVKVRAV